MNNKTEMVSVPRELLLRLLSVYSTSPYPAWHELAAALEAAPAEDVRAVGEEPVAWRGCNSDGEVVTEWIDGAPPAQMFDLCGNAASFGKIELAYSHSQRPVAPQCSEVISQCSEHLRTQAKLFPNSVVYPRPPRHTGFLLPEREEPGYTLEQMQAYVVECIKAFIKQNT